VEWIRQLGLAYARFGFAYPNHYRFMFMTDKRQQQVSPEGQQAFGLLRAAVAKAVAAGRFPEGNVDATAQVLWASLHGVVSLLVTYDAEQFPGVPAMPDLVERVIENGIRGFLAGPDAAAGLGAKPRSGGEPPVRRAGIHSRRA
jgi:hypothetical protein